MSTFGQNKLARHQSVILITRVLGAVIEWYY